jgi:hypothetical protein
MYKRIFPFLAGLLLRTTTLTTTYAFHDCIQAAADLRRRRSQFVAATIHNNKYQEQEQEQETKKKKKNPTSCAGGLCVGMTNGPHLGGNASYPVAWNGTAGTKVTSYMTVPELPQLVDGITYYLWTDVFFGDASQGRMNQLVPQLLLGSALDASSGPPEYHPYWHTHRTTWAFGAHYFFEITSSPETNETQGHAAYGDLHPTWPGEFLYTTFELSAGGDGMDVLSPKWTLTMGVVGDDTRVSKLTVERPYMGMGSAWDKPTTSWIEPSYRHMCINACWELYGANDAAHLPSSGARYDLTIEQPQSRLLYNFSTWERDEGNGNCPSCRVKEYHDDQIQKVRIAIGVSPKIKKAVS